VGQTARDGRPPTVESAEESPEEKLLARLDGSRLPRHVAVIMDGNGRWAQERGMARLNGHRAGRVSVRETVETCGKLGIEFLTLYTFSAENWRRPETEIRALMALIEETLRREIEDLHGNQVRVRHVGQREGLPDSLLKELDRAAARTGDNTGLRLQLAINYGGRQEIAAAAAELAREVSSGTLAPAEVTEAELGRHLYCPDLPDVDLLIRTGGEFRVSNYLLWQIAYAEIHVTSVLWPDFRRVHVLEALVEYQGRQRRFGGVEDAA